MCLAYDVECKLLHTPNVKQINANVNTVLQDHSTHFQLAPYRLQGYNANSPIHLLVPVYINSLPTYIFP